MWCSSFWKWLPLAGKGVDGYKACKENNIFLCLRCVCLGVGVKEIENTISLHNLVMDHNKNKWISSTCCCFASQIHVFSVHAKKMEKMLICASKAVSVWPVKDNMEADDTTECSAAAFCKISSITNVNIVVFYGWMLCFDLDVLFCYLCKTAILTKCFKKIYGRTSHLC